MFKHLLTFLLALSALLAHAQTWQTVYQQADSLREKRAFEQAIPLYQNALTLAEQAFGTNSENYLLTRNSLGRCMSFADTKENAEAFLLENLQLCKAFGEQTTVYAAALHIIGTFYLPQSRGNKPALSEQHLRQAIALRKELLGQMHPEYANSLNNLAVLYYNTGNYAAAASIVQETLNIRKETLGQKHPDYAGTLRNLATLYENLGNYAAAEPLYKEALNIRKEALGQKHPEYALLLNSLAILYWRMGNYAASEPLYQEALNIQKETLGQKHPEYANSLNNLAALYFNLGNYAAAEPLYQEALNIRNETLGPKHPEYANSLNNLAILYLNLGNYTAAEPLYKEALNTRKDLLGPKHLDYAASLHNLAGLYRSMGNYAAAEPLYKEALNIQRETLGQKHPDYASSLNNLALLYRNMGNYAAAEPLHQEALSIRKEALGQQHPDYALSLNSLADLYRDMGNYAAAEPLYHAALQNKTAQIRELLPLLSEKERLAYLASINSYFASFQQFAIDFYPQKPAISGDFYDQILFAKGIVFSSTQKMRRQILSSNDSSLKADFERWKALKMTYIKLLEKTTEEKQKSGINLEQMATQINELEKNLSRRSSQFAENVQVKTYRWQQVRDQLAKHEAVVEIIRTARNFPPDSLGRRPDQTVYAALIITPDTQQQPEIVLLQNGDELEGRYLNFYKNTLQLRIEDEHSYQQYWLPIAEKLAALRKKGFSRIFFAPDGVYHQISLNTLQNPATGRFLLEEQNIQLIGTSRDLIEIGKKERKLSKNFESYQAALLGFPLFDLEDKTNNTQSDQRGLSISQQIAIQRGSVALLPGTKDEIERIKQQFEHKKIAAKAFTGAEASEEQVKNLLSPTILHIATHGFFLLPPKQKEVSSTQQAMQNKALENPFMRTGLLLAGCENTHAEGSEDGVLTAEEAMNLHLDDTELVVLSACETGLGDVQNGEGVFGLQRAFEQAGAKTVLMSLWKVSDEATQMLMDTFYKNLLAGQRKRAAFKAAQLTLKARYPEPYYWGAFVMVGE